MNQQLRDIERQSYTEIMHERGGTYPAFDKAKFAYLIVRACAGIADQHTHEGDWDIAHMIRKHFGVEQ